MFLLGILSLFQITIIPGLILLKLLKIKTGSIIQSFLYSFGLSLYSNYLFVCILTYLKLYIATNVYILFCIEIMLIIYLMIRGDISFVFKKTINDYYIQLKKFVNNQTPLYRFIFLSSCLLILFFISFIPINARTIFYFNDVINYWNRLALVWASNNFPTDTSHYPQLFTTNISLNYVIMNNTVLPFFIKAFMPLFPIGILLMFFDLAQKKRPFLHLTGLLIYACILILFYPVLYILDVNADIIISFLSFLTFYTIIKNGEFKFDAKAILLVIIFSSSAADTKLVGLYILGVAILWISFVIHRNRKSISKQDIAKTILYISIILTGNLFWYIIKPASMYAGFNQSQFLPASYIDRVIQGTNMLLYSFGSLLSIFLLSTLIFSLFVKEIRYLVLIMIIIPLFFWVFFFCYDYRNLSISIPFIAYASSFGLKYFYDKNLWMQKFVQDFNSKNYLSINYSNRKKTILSLIFVLSLAAFFLIAGTNGFFNFGMQLSYAINKIYYMYYRTIYTIEFGYYKSVEYFIDSLRILSILLLLLFFLRKTRIKLSHIFIVIMSLAVFLNFTLLKKENLIKRQVYDTQMVKAHNLHYRVYSYLINTGISGLIITDYSPVCRLIPPEGIHFKYSTTSIDSMSFIKQKNTGTIYLLFEENKLSKGSKKFLDQQILNKKYIIQFDDGDFVFLKVVS